MCFKTLPVSFDGRGNATLRGGANPYGYTNSTPNHVEVTETEREERIKRLVARNGHIKDLNMDPITRIAGALALHVQADLDNGEYLDAHAQATLFRGYELILMGRDPRDAIFVSSRACGVCGGVHAHCAAYAIEMAMGIKPPPLGTVVRNMEQAAEMGYDNPLHLYLLAGPDYSESVIKASNPELWPIAESWPCPSAHIHGFKKMSDLMVALNPLTGSLYREGLDFTRLSREIVVILTGKYPHPQNVVPGGVSTTLTLQTLNEFHSKLGRIFDYAQRMMAVWDDIPAFFYEADERYMQVGSRPMTMIDAGYWDDPYAYDGTYENCNEWGDKRWSTPGAVIDGKLVTTRLTDINIGLEEFVEHAYYEPSHTTRHATDPLGNPLSPWHPWNKRTLPKPGARDWKDKYTWSTSVRWDRRAVEAGCYARMIINAQSRKIPTSDFIESTGHSVRMLVPKGEVGEREVEWHMPDVWNAFERNRARAHHYLYSQLVGLESLFEAYKLFQQGERQVASLTPEELEKAIPQDNRLGVGFWGAGRGWLVHHLEMDKGKLTNYQITTPSTLNASPRDPWGNPGPYEEAVMNTPMIEDLSNPESFTSIDMMRAIRSFDPCMPCTTHAYTGDGEIVREVNTCSCGGD